MRKNEGTRAMHGTNGSGWGAVFRMGQLSAVFLALLTAPAVAQEAQPADAAASVRYVRVKEEGGKLLNFPDVQSSVWRVVSDGDVLRVVGEQKLNLPSGEEMTFLEAEAPGGLPVWVFGQYLSATERDGILRTTTNVRMRPKPTSDTSSMAHPMTLPRGERVRFVERNDPARPMAEDWVKVWSPESARAWILASRTEAIDHNAGSAAWTQASKLLRGPMESPAKAREAAASQTSESVAAPDASGRGDVPLATVQNSLDKADELYAAAQTTEGADYRDAVAAYQKALDEAGPDTPLGRVAASRLQIAQAAADLAALRLEIAEVDAARERRQKDLEREERLAEARDDPLWGRFLARGWVMEREVEGEARYFIDWRGSEVCEVICSNGRYDLSLFRGFEIGVMGTTSRGPIAETADTPRQPSLLDLYRIEVISGSGARAVRR